MMGQYHVPLLSHSLMTGMSLCNTIEVILIIHICTFKYNYVCMYVHTYVCTELSTIIKHVENLNKLLFLYLKTRCHKINIIPQQKSLSIMESLS